MDDARGGMARWCAALLCTVHLACAAAPQPVPAPTSLLVDQAGALSGAQRTLLGAKLHTLQASGRVQAAILISSGIGDEALPAYSLRVVQAWRLGRAKRDDGLLILVVPSRNAARIEVGYGLEGDIPDVLAGKWLGALLPRLRNNELAEGLEILLDQVDRALPAAAIKTDKLRELIDQHPQWTPPFVIMLFSPLALFPLLLGGFSMLGRRPARVLSGSSIASGSLLAAFAGGAAATLWGASAPAFVAAGCAFLLPLMWGLNFQDNNRLARGLQWMKALGNLLAITIVFTLLTLGVGTAFYLSGGVQAMAAPPLLSALFALGLAAFLFPTQSEWIKKLLGSYMVFLLISAVVYAAMKDFNPEPGAVAFTVGGVVTALIVLAMVLDDRERARAATGAKTMRWSLGLTVLTLLIVLPFGIMLLIQSLIGDELSTRLMLAAAGGGSIAGVLWWAAGVGLFAALRVGLGG